MANKLTNLKINTLGSVDTPANQFGKAVLLKRADAGAPPGDSGSKDTLPQKLMKAWKDVYTSVSRYTEFVTSAYTSDSTSVSAYTDTPEALLEGDEEDGSVEKAASAVCPECGATMKDGKCASCGYTMKKSLGEGVTSMPDQPVNVTELLKNQQLPEEVRKALQQAADVQKQLDTATSSIADLQKNLDIEKAARLDREYIAKAAEYKALPVGKDFAQLLKGLGTKAPEEFAQLEGILKAADAALTETGLFKEVGSGTGSAGMTAADEIGKKAEELRKSDPSLTKEAAITKAWSDNPDLYERHRRGE